MTSNQSGTNYHYVIVEAVGEKGNAASVERGLFQGLNEIAAGAYLWMKPKAQEKISKSCNLAYYNILSIETFDGTTRCYTFFRKDKKEQKKALSDIKGIYEVLKERMLRKNDDYMLDTDKYISVPNNLLETGSKSIVGSHRPAVTRKADFYGNCHHASTSAMTTPSVYQKRDPEPTAFKRRSKKPTEDNLATLNEKLDLIAKGEYDINFPKVKGEKKYERGDAVAEAQVEDDKELEDYYGDAPFTQEVS